MRRFLDTLLLIVLLAAATATSSAASSQALHLDPEKTEIGFLLEATGHDIHGLFHVVEGDIRFDLATGAASGSVTVDAVHSGTGNKSRDEKMHGEVLESEHFPRFVFRAEKVEGSLVAGELSRVTLHGQLELHGDSHPVSLAAEVLLDGESLSGRSTLEIPFVEWGLNDPSILFLKVAKSVGVTIDLVGQVETAASAGAAAKQEEVHMTGKPEHD